MAKLTKFKVTTPFPLVAACVVGLFEYQREYENIWKRTKEIDFKVDCKKTTLSNELLRTVANKPWNIHEYAFDLTKISRNDAKNPNPVTLFDVLDWMVTNYEGYFKSGEVKFVLDLDENGKPIDKELIKELKILQDDERISSSNFISSEILIKIKNAAPISLSIGNIDDSQVDSLQDIKDQIQTNVGNKKDKLAVSIDG